MHQLHGVQDIVCEPTALFVCNFPFENKVLQHFSTHLIIWSQVDAHANVKAQNGQFATQGQFEASVTANFFGTKLSVADYTATADAGEIYLPSILFKVSDHKSANSLLPSTKASSLTGCYEHVQVSDTIMFKVSVRLLNDCICVSDVTQVS